MDFCPKCGSMLLNGPICGKCNHNSRELYFDALKIDNPKNYISISNNDPEYAEILLELIINKDKINVNEINVLKVGDKIIEAANANFINEERRIILKEFNEFLESKNDLIDKTEITSKYCKDYFDYYSDLDMDKKIDEYNFNITTQKILDDFDGKYISYSEISQYLEGKNLSFNMDSIVDEHNKRIIEQQMDNYQYYFDNINGKSLDNNQRIAVLTDDDNTQIVAGAGTGKTLTIQAKVKFLIEKQNVNPKDILCMSFSNSARDDLEKKLKQTIGDAPVEVRTFHSLGYSILGKNDEYKEVPEYELVNFIDDYFKELFIEKQDLLKDVIEFFCFYFNIIYNNENDLKLETIKSRLTRLDEYDEYLKEYLEVTSVKRNREYMNNIPELIIANYLFIHNIAYEYGNQAKFKEKNYEKYISKYSTFLFGDMDDKIPNHVKFEFINEFDNEFGYKKLDFYPSFYLLNDDIILDVSPISYDWKDKLEINEKVKIKDCLEKRDILNNSYKTKILTIFNQDDVDNLLDDVEHTLLENNVVLEDVDYENLFDLLISQDNLLEYRRFLKTVDQFINLFKGNAKNIDNWGRDISDEKFKKYFDENHEKYSNSIEKRNELYLDMIKKIYYAYKDYLDDSEYIDFNDMINEAVIKLRNGGLIHKYKYVIVDEYQDTSYTRFNLLKEVQNVTGSKVVVVGDDWQSIYGFTGCNVNLFSQFDKYFEHPKMVKINVTRRNSQKLIDVIGEFIQEKNNNLIPKKLLSEKIENKKPIKIFEYVSRAEEVLALINILDKISEEKSDAEILILGRNNKDKFEIACKEIFEMTEFKDFTKIDYSFKPDLKIVFRTVHKSKGLEADYVVVLNLNNQINGFPNKIANDPILDFVSDKEDENNTYPEERRLFYVALTRTRNDVYLFSKSTRPSSFVSEIRYKDGVEKVNFVFSNEDIIKINKLLKKSFEVIETDNICPQCGVGQINLILNNEKGTSYFRCSNFCGWNGGPYHNSDYSWENKRYISNIKYSKVCPKCNHMLILKENSVAGGYFLGCNTYRKGDPNSCQETRNLYNFEEFNELDFNNLLNYDKKEYLNKTVNGVYYLKEYIPKDKLLEYEGDDRVDFSKRILDYKDNKNYEVNLLTKDLIKFISHISNNVIDDNIQKLALIAVPPSKVKKINRSSMRKSIDLIEKSFEKGELQKQYQCNKEIINLKDLIKRVENVPTAHLGEGRASPEQHIDSMKCCENNLSNENIAYIVLDDITTTGNTMKACNEILLNHGVNENNIYNFVLGATVGDDDEEI